ncbi:MAG: alpha-amylase family glycosyl hydrolase [Gammaproteobacteria bacterium]
MTGCGSSVRNSYPVSAGTPGPPGAHHTPACTRFTVYSREASAMALLLYRGAADDAPFQVITLAPPGNRNFFFWHVTVDGLPAGTHYNWRVTRRSADGREEEMEVLDPFARAVTMDRWQRTAWRPGATLGMRGVVTTAADEPAPPPIGLEGAIIYELHLGGFTRHPSSGVRQPGTFSGLAEKIPYLRDLGVTHVQLLPVAAFDEQDVPASVAALGLRNFWGYSPVAPGSLHPGYASDPDPATHESEFLAMVQAFHAAGIGVLLDVVLNHTAEGGAGGPELNFKALMPTEFYHRDGAAFRDYTGCGNTINANHPVVIRMLVQWLRTWAAERHVDGFRFDLASVFVRDVDGAPLAQAPAPWAIEDALPGTPLIAEPWDAAGLYHVGNFPGHGWSEWNGRYRDALRRFLRGDPGLTGEVATCLAGSSDLYQASDRRPLHSVNYITSHDGFTLLDLVSYRDKHNEANGEQNRDGWEHNLSWNCGTEGDTLDEATRRLRSQHARNAMALLLLSQGTPMLLAGDEVLRTQGGNNNAWCQDNATSWFDWRLTETNGDMLNFVRQLIALRRRHPGLSRPAFLTGRTNPARGMPDIAWHGNLPGESPWNASARYLAFTLSGCSAAEEDLHVLINMSDRSESVELPAIAGRRWHLAVDTARESPWDIVARDAQITWAAPRYLSQPRSVVVLEAR